MPILQEIYSKSIRKCNIGTYHPIATVHHQYLPSTISYIQTGEPNDANQRDLRKR